MKTFATLATTIVALASFAMAAPSGLDERALYVPCSGLYDTPECCATDVLGVADLDCVDPPTVPTSGTDFSKVCSAIGQKARCCALPILGQGVLCDTPAGVTD